MRHFKTGSVRGYFKVLTSTRAAQAAMMTLRPGQSSSDDVENEHPKAEQWVFVVSGRGRATVGKRRITLKTNALLLIEKGEPHRITNTSRRPMVTLHFYSPPAYDSAGNVQSSAH